MIDKELLNLLICPVCGQGAPVKPGENGNTLVCTQCGRQYPVRQGIPVMLVDEALPAKHTESSPPETNTARPETRDEPPEK